MYLFICYENASIFRIKKGERNGFLCDVRIFIDKAKKKHYNNKEASIKEQRSMNGRIYLDHAATTPLDEQVLKEMLPYLTGTFGNADSPHAEGRKAMAAIDDARDRIAELLHARKNEIYFTSGGTESDNFAILGAARAKRKAGKNKVILSSIEHHAALFAGETLKKDGFEVVYLPVNAGGRVETNALKTVLDDTVALVGIMAANNETGVKQPIQELACFAHEQGAVFFSDAVQLAPYEEIDVTALGVDMLSMSSHKFYGPKGCGVLYIKNGVKVEKLVGGGEQERGMRGGTLNVPSVVGLAAAYEKTVKEMERSNQKIRALSQLFMQEISCLKGVTRNGSGDMLPAVLNLRFEGVENTAFLYSMDLKGVALAAGSACASASVKPSHVLTAMGLTAEQAKECVRLSFGKDNTEEEIRQGARLTLETVGRLQNLH